MKNIALVLLVVVRIALLITIILKYGYGAFALTAVITFTVVVYDGLVMR